MATSDWVGISIVAREEWMDERNGSLGCFYLLAFSRGGRRERGGLLLASLLLREGVVGSERARGVGSHLHGLIKSEHLLPSHRGSSG